MHWNCSRLSVAAGGDGLELENVGPTFQVLLLCLQNYPPKLSWFVLPDEIRATCSLWSDFCITLKNGFGKCSLFVLSANGWKDQNMDSSFSRKIKPYYGLRIVRLANRVAVWRQSEVYRFISRKFSGMNFFSHARLYPFDKLIKSLYFRSFVVSVLLARFHFKVRPKIALTPPEHFVYGGQYVMTFTQSWSKITISFT